MTRWDPIWPTPHAHLVAIGAAFVGANVADMLQILNDPGLVQAREGHMRRLGDLFAGRPLARPFFLLGIGGEAPVDPYAEPERWVAEALASLAGSVGHLRDPVVFRPLCLEFWPYGVHFVDRMFGARVYEHAGQWWSERLAAPVGELQPPDLERDETWALARRAAEAFVASGVTVPLFGMATIASALNIAVNLYGEAFLVALALDPDAARRDLGVISAVLCDLHRWYRERVPAEQLQAVVAAGRCQPPGHGQLCGCSTHLLSAAAYREFIASLDGALLSVYPGGGMIHLCGAHTQHLPAWREMASLRAVQLNDRAAEDLETYFRGLREDQMIYLNPTPTMTVERALALTHGRRLVLVAEPPEAR